jgi:hypothetical protein
MIITNPYLTTGNPDTENNLTLYAPGELGAIYQRGDSQWQQVQLDSGATAAANLAVASGQILYWKNKLQKIVTNDIKQAVGTAVSNGWSNHVAGVLRNTATPGNYIWIMQRGLGISIKTSQTMTIGQSVIANTATPVADVAGVNVGTAPTAQKLGVATSANAASAVTVDLNITDWVL